MEQALREAQKLPAELQADLAQHLLNDIENELMQADELVGVDGMALSRTDRV